MRSYIIGIIVASIVIAITLGARFYSEESQNKVKRYIGNMNGYKHGRVDILTGQSKPSMTFLQVEKLTSASASLAVTLGKQKTDAFFRNSITSLCVQLPRKHTRSETPNSDAN